MSRRDQKRQQYASMFLPKKQASDSGSHGPDKKVCGTCSQYSESAYSNDGRGSCKFLKAGSDISKNQPVYVLEGKEGFFTKTLFDASFCKYYEKMRMIDKDGYECSDPVYRRSIRQLQ
jgi:hypothetical protein